MRYSSLAFLAVSVVVVVVQAEQTPLSDIEAAAQGEQQKTDLSVCPDPRKFGVEAVFGHQYEFRCEDPPTGIIAAKCCPESSIIPDGKGTFSVGEGCWDTYYHHQSAMDEYTWLPEFIRDYLGLRREAVQGGWKTRNNCGSGHDSMKGLCCKSHPTMEQLINGATWSTDCFFPTAWGDDGLQSAPPACVAAPQTNEEDLWYGGGADDWELHYGEQYAFDCDPSAPGPSPGSVAAMCCRTSDLVPDGEGTFKAAHECSGRYHGANGGDLSLRWLLERGFDLVGERLGLQERPSYGWSTQGNCGSGYDGRQGMCCKKTPPWNAGASWASDCVPPTTFIKTTETFEYQGVGAAKLPFEEPDAWESDTLFSCKSAEVGFGNPGGQTAVCCPPSATVLPEDSEGRYRVDTPGCTYAVSNGWAWRVNPEAKVSTMNDCGPPGDGWTGLCCNTLSYSESNSVADEVGDCIFAPPHSV